MKDSDSGLPRRRVLAGSAALLGLGAPGLRRPAGQLSPGATADCAPPAAFPANIPVYQQTYQNWSGGLRADDVWTCTPSSPQEVATLANWAAANGYRLRARGKMHGWSPLTVTADTGCATPVLLVDTSALASMSIAAPGVVRVQTGAVLDDLLAYLETNGYGMTATPAPGDLTVGGVLAIDAHGTAIPADDETPVAGDYYGSLSNRILSLTAVVWDAGSSSYVVRTFERADAQCAALLTHLGRAFLTEVTLSVRANYHLRCVSDVTIPASELFAAPAAAGARSFASYVHSSGRVEAIWFPFTANPWLKVWTLSPQAPPTSRPTTSPYNYPFADTVPKPVAQLAGALVSGQWYLAPTFGQVQYDTAAAGLTATLSADLWGLSKNLLLYVKPTTLRMFANGYAVLTSTADIQRVVCEFTGYFQRQLSDQRSGGDPGHSAGHRGRESRSGRRATRALRDPGTSGPSGLGRRGLVRRADPSDHARPRRLLPGSGAVPLRELLGFLRRCAPRMVKGLGFHRRRGVERSDRHRQHDPRHLPGRSRSDLGQRAGHA